MKPDRVDFEAKWRNSMLSMLSEHVEAAHVPTVQQPTVFSFLQATKTPIKDDTLFFFLECGRCRTVARSLHEHKQ